MEYRSLPHTDLVLSRLGFGGGQLGGADWGAIDREQVVSAAIHALDCGVNWFDVADVYGLGQAEETLATVLGSRRHDVTIVSKFGVNWHQQSQGERARTFFDSRPERVVEALQQSLRRLRIDCIPLYLIHWPDPHTPIAATMDALLQCQERGWIKYIGVSNFTRALLQEANELHTLAAIEVPYNLIDRRSETEQFPYCQEVGMGVLAYGPLAQGLLTGKYTPSTSFGSDDHRHRLTHFQPEYWQQHTRLLNRIQHIAEKHQTSYSQVALRWVLDDPHVTCAILGIKSVKQLEDCLGALTWTMSDEERTYLTCD